MSYRDNGNTRLDSARFLLDEALRNYQWKATRDGLERVARNAADVLMCVENQEARYWLEKYNRQDEGYGW